MLPFPHLFAHRGTTDEPWRIDRLRRVYRQVSLVAAQTNRAAFWHGAIAAMYEREGELTVWWRSLYDVAKFGDIVQRGWHSAEEFTRVKHRAKWQAKRPWPLKSATRQRKKRKTVK